MDRRPYLLNLTRQGRGPTIVLIHGAAGGTLIWQSIVGRLAEKFDVIAVDLLGFGDSPKPRIAYTPKAHVEAIRYTLIQHGIDAPFTMVGLSMGCLLVLEYAQRWPSSISRLVCIGPPYFSDEAEARYYMRRSFNARIALERPLVGRIVMKTLWKVAARSCILAARFSNDYTPEMVQQSMKNTFHAFRSTLVHCIVENRAIPLLERTTAVPQDYLYGSLDRYMPLEHIQGILANQPRSTLTVLPGVGHNPVVIAPEATANWMMEILEGAA